MRELVRSAMLSESSRVRFIRFVVPDRDDDSGYRQGFIQAAGALDDSGTLSATESARFREILRWFRENLPVPTRFTRTRNASHKRKRALSWFKGTATLQLAYAREVVQMLAGHDVVVEMITTDRPGYIVYEDQYQIVAEPFADTRT